MGRLDDLTHVEARDRESWRAWLERNHATAAGAWLVSWRPGSGSTSIDYEAAIEEALCFGWVDGRAGRVDERRTKLHFAPRSPRSGWAATNKARVERLIAEGRMAPAGLEAVERAKASGTWTLFDAVERLEVPDDLASALAARPPARGHWDAFPRSVRRTILAWIALARRAETRAGRIEQTAILAQRNERANQGRPRG